MKVLLVNTPSSPKFRGGDTVQMEMTAKHLRELGVEATISCDARPNAAGFDIAHVFNLRTIKQTLVQVEHLKMFGIPLVMSPIYLDVSTPLWGTQAVQSIFRANVSEAERAKLLAKLADRSLKVVMPGGRQYTAAGPNRPFPEYDDLQRRILSSVDHLIPNSLLEISALTKALGVVLPFTIAHYGVNVDTCSYPDPTPFIKTYGIRDFILQVGRIEAPKNQLMLAYSLRKMKLPLVLIGSSMDTQYVEACRRFGPSNMLVVPHLPPKELSAAYAAARVHVLPSWVETCGFVSLEAALANCNLVLSIAGYELEYFHNLAYYCDPARLDSIGQATLSAYENYDRDGSRRDDLKERIRRNYCWAVMAEKTLDAYLTLLKRQSNPLHIKSVW